MIRVLHIVLSLETGGLENGVVNLVNHADTTVFHVDVLCLRAQGALAQRVPPEQVLFTQPAVAIAAAIKRIYQVCRAGGYDIVHTHGWATLLAGFIGARLARVPVVINGEHGVLYDQSRLQRWLQRCLFNAVTLNLSVCDDLVKQIAQRFAVDKQLFRVIINGVDTQKFAPDVTLRQQLRDQFKLQDEVTVIGSVGRLVPIKNYPLLLRAFANVRQAGYPVSLMLVGDGSERAALQQLASELSITEQVIFTGQQHNIAAHLQAMDIFVLPSFSEGLSNTLLEAMACGLPVLASDVGGNPEIVNAQTGALFASDDEAALTATLIQWVSQPSQRLQLAASARDYCLTRHAISAMVRTYEQTYVECLQ